MKSDPIHPSLWYYFSFRKHKKHSKHEGRQKRRPIKEDPKILSSDSVDDRKVVVKKKKSKHRSSSSSSSDCEEERKAHHKKRKKSKHKPNNSDEVETKVKVEPDEDGDKPRHHHRHRHHHKHEERVDPDRHGHSSRPAHSDREPKRNKHSDEHTYDDGNHGRRSQDRRTHDNDRNTRDTESKGSRWQNDRPQHGSSSQLRDKGPKKPFCDEAEEYEWGRKDGNNEDKNNAQQPKQKPDFGLSGKLTEDTNMYNGVVIKYSEPPDARKPKRRWRLYPFKEDTQLPVLHIHRQSAFLLGRDRKVADIPVDHPSCSKQHAALQYRLTDYTREDGTKGKRIRLYIIDLESANGTFVNNKKIDPKRYVELLEKDVIKFGFSLREYVLLHEHSKDSDLDDDVQDDE